MSGPWMSCSAFVCHPSRCGHDLKWLSHVIGTLPRNSSRRKIRHSRSSVSQGLSSHPSSCHKVSISAMATVFEQWSVIAIEPEIRLFS